MWQKVAKFKGAKYFRKALYLHNAYCSTLNPTPSNLVKRFGSQHKVLG